MYTWNPCIWEAEARRLSSCPATQKDPASKNKNG